MNRNEKRMKINNGPSIAPNYVRDCLFKQRRQNWEKKHTLDFGGVVILVLSLCDSVHCAISLFSFLHPLYIHLKVRCDQNKYGEHRAFEYIYDTLAIELRRLLLIWYT